MSAELGSQYSFVLFLSKATRHNGSSCMLLQSVGRAGKLDARTLTRCPQSRAASIQHTFAAHVWGGAVRRAECPGPRVPDQVSAELGGQYSDVLSASDVALYGGLTALASLERPELKASVVDNVGFRELLELNPEARTSAVLSNLGCPRRLI